MRHLICILCSAAILLTSCIPQGKDPTPQPIEESQTPGTEVEHIVPTETTVLLPTHTNTVEIEPSTTPTITPDNSTYTPQIFPPIQSLNSGEIITITQIQMFNPLFGWGAGYQDDSGDHILYTEDGGRTWDDRTPPDKAAENHNEIESSWSHFQDSLTSWVIYAPRGIPPALQEKIIWRTGDGGLTWDASAPLKADGMEDTFRPGSFTSMGEDHGWLLVHVGGGMSHDYSYLYATRDGGSTWERIADPYGDGIQSLQNTGIAFADPEYGWVTKDNLGVMPGAFFEQTTDGGYTWERVVLPAPLDLDWFNESSLCETSEPTFIGDQTGMMIVKCRLPEDIQNNIEWSLTYIYRTNNRGLTWEHTILPSPVDRLSFITDESGWAFGRDHYRTIDGGVTWDLVKTVNWDGDFSFIDPQNGWVVARNEGEIALVVTNNGGQTWEIIESKIR
jgi:photosystem II stability/assembly factor-like uncharacterized protein